jgi:hypothetical protein
MKKSRRTSFENISLYPVDLHLSPFQNFILAVNSALLVVLKNTTVCKELACKIVLSDRCVSMRTVSTVAEKLK